MSPVQVGASIGIAHFVVDGADLDALLASADQGMYEVKTLATRPLGSLP